MYTLCFLIFSSFSSFKFILDHFCNIRPFYNNVLSVHFINYNKKEQLCVNISKSFCKIL